MDINISNCATIAHMLAVWWDNSSGNSIHAWLLRLVPAFILWKIWRARNNAYFEDIGMDSMVIINKIRDRIYNIYMAFNIKKHQGKTSAEVLQFMRVQVHSVQEFCVIWFGGRHLLLNGRGLNTDGASRGNPGMSGIGGVLRNHNHACHLAGICNNSPCMLKLWQFWWVFKEQSN